jgi:hypothetical protein
MSKGEVRIERILLKRNESDADTSDFLFVVPGSSASATSGRIEQSSQGDVPSETGRLPEGQTPTLAQLVVLSWDNSDLLS